jgi:hypothetical protein
VIDTPRDPAGATASRMLQWAGRILPGDADAGWPEAMRAEVDSIPPGRGRLTFAVGCLVAATRERMRARRTPIAVRLVGLGLASVFVVQAAVESHQWMNGNGASRRGYLLVIAVAVSLLTITTLRLAARRADLAAITLAAGAAGGFTAATLWLASALLSPTMPADAGSGVVLIATSAALAAVVVAIRTRALREACAAGLVAATIGTALVFALAEVTIQEFPGRIPDLVGPVMPGGATSGQVLLENRIEIVDGYVGLLFVMAGLLLALLLVAWSGRAQARSARV